MLLVIIFYLYELRISLSFALLEPWWKISDGNRKFLEEKIRRFPTLSIYLAAELLIFKWIFSDTVIFAGAGTAMLGNNSAMACTTAVEELIADHYNNQIKKLMDADAVAHSALIKVTS